MSWAVTSLVSEASWGRITHWFSSWTYSVSFALQETAGAKASTELVDDLRIKTTLVCGALALAIAISSVLRTKVRNVHLFFAGTAAVIGFWYLSQSLFGIEGIEESYLERLRVVLAVLLPVFVAKLFEAMVPDDQAERRRARVGRLSLIAAVPMMGLALLPGLEKNAFTFARVIIFLYVTVVVAASLYELGQRGHHSRSRATQRRVRFLTVTGALAGLFSVADFVWVLGYNADWDPPPIGVVLSVVFLFMLAQALRHERLLDLFEMLSRLLVAIATAFLLAGVFYALIEGLDQPTQWLNALLVAIVVLVLFNPLRDWVEKRIVAVVFRDRGKLESALRTVRRRLAHTLELDEMALEVMRAFERSRAVTTAALYLRIEDGTVFEQLAVTGEGAPKRIEVATANALLEQLDHGTVILEQIRRRGETGDGSSPEAVLAAAEVLGALRESAVVLGIRAEEGELMGLVVVADNRIGDAFGPEDISVLEGLATQIAVVMENSRVYEKMKERDRLAVLGQMAAGLAHEIRNPLGAIKGAAQLLADPHPAAEAPDDTAQEFIGIILEEVDRLNQVVGSVLDLARQNTHVVAPLDVNAVVRRTLQVMTPEWADEPLNVHTKLDDAIPRTAIAPDQLRQVLMNVLRNAVQAVKYRGKVSVETRVRRRNKDEWVVIRITDDGTGIAAPALRQIFLPFYTTKDEGTGLGLAICQRIVQEAGGRIDVRSQIGEGTTFEIILPGSMEALGTPTPNNKLVRTEAGSELGGSPDSRAGEETVESLDQLPIGAESV